jgi:hypothetical protein
LRTGYCLRWRLFTFDLTPGSARSQSARYVANRASARRKKAWARRYSRPLLPRQDVGSTWVFASPRLAKTRLLFCPHFDVSSPNCERRIDFWPYGLECRRGRLIGNCLGDAVQIGDNIMSASLLDREVRCCNGQRPGTRQTMSIGATEQLAAVEIVLCPGDEARGI